MQDILCQYTRANLEISIGTAWTDALVPEPQTQYYKISLVGQALHLPPPKFLLVYQESGQSIVGIQK